MIVDQIGRLSTYIGLNDKFSSVVRFLNDNDAVHLNCGRYELEEGVYVNAGEYEPKTSSVWEAHRKYIDLQYVVSGDETMKWASIEKLEHSNDYLPENDCEYFEVENGDLAFPLYEGMFAVFFPGDVHCPCNFCHSKTVKKLVFKIPV